MQKTTLIITLHNQIVEAASKISGSWEKYYATLTQLPDRFKQPASFVVDAVPRFKKSGITSVLDLGCGAGRHSIYLAKKGLEVIGVDSSISALKLANKWVRAENLKNAVFAQATMTDIPFRDSEFDSVVSVSVIHHALKRDIVKTINEIQRILKSNGFFLANLASAFDPRYASGEKVETRTYKSLEAYEDKRFEELHHFFTEREVYRLMSCFRQVEVERMKDKPNYWKVTAIK